MCVTNTTFRRSQQQPVQLPNACLPSSGLAQRLMGSFQVSTVPVKTESQQPQLPVKTEAQQPQAVSQFPFPSASACTKSRPKRRRKPQKPGMTAKMNERHFVVHNYHDHANDIDNGEQVTEDDDEEHHRRKGGVAIAFPLKLHAILDQVEEDGLGHVISWQPHGRCFVIHQPKIFVDSVMPKYFRQTKLTSFQRQLNLYGFCRLTRGNDAGGYYHELFLRGMTFLTKQMIRTKVKGTKFKAASSPEAEPDFYTLPPVIISPHSSPSHESNYAHEEVSEAPLAAPTPLSNVFSIFQQQRSQYQNSMLEPYPFFVPQQPAAQFLMQQAVFQEPQMNSADQILDEAVDELFLSATSEVGDLDDFVREWNPVAFKQSIDNDAQLGYMLDCLLED